MNCILFYISDKFFNRHAITRLNHQNDKQRLSSMQRIAAIGESQKWHQQRRDVCVQLQGLQRHTERKVQQTTGKS